MATPDTFQHLLDQILGLPPSTVYLVIGALAAMENVFPPVPADTAVALGAFLSHAGTVTAWSVFLVTWSANALSATLVYGVARTQGRTFVAGPTGRRLLAPRHLERLERMYQRYGVWGIFLSRFLPGVRALVPPFAGIAGLAPFKALAPTILASGIWYGTLTLLVVNVATQVEDVARLVARTNAVAVGATLALVVVAIVAVRRRHRGAARPDQP